MIVNFLKIALRTFRRNGTYSFINIAGLSIGIASSILILIWVYDELTFNQYFKNYENLYQVKLNNKTNAGIITMNVSSWPLKEALPSADSHIKKVAITVFQSALLSVGDKKLTRRGIDVSESFLSMFDYRMIKGDPETALNDPRSIVLTKSTATALFGPEDPMGKTITIKIQNNEELKVTGVVEDMPSNVSNTLVADFFLPFSYFEQTAPWVVYAKSNWDNYGFVIFAELNEGSDVESVNTGIGGIIKKNNPNSRDVEVFLHPMSRWRLHNFENGKESGGLIDYVILFTGIAVFILAIACINFMNLATARSEHRAREVGIRKSLGSRRKDLIFQFMGESILIAAVAFIVSIVWVEMALPFYNTLVGKTLTLDLASPYFWLFGAALVLITGLLAGSYPAFYLSSFLPVKTLKGRIQTGNSAIVPRKALVTLQFGFSIVLIVGAVVMFKQIDFLRGRDAGYDRENLMLVWSNEDIEKNFTGLKEELVSSGAAVSVTKSNSPVTRIFSSSPMESWTGMIPGEKLEVNNVATEYDYTKTLGINMLQGRDFSREFKSDTAALLLNQAAVDAMGLKDPVGDQVQMWGQKWTIIGVMENVLMGSGSRTIDPLVVNMDPNWSTTITMKLPETMDLSGSIKKVEEVFKKYNPDYPFEYRFADDEFDQKFSQINMVGTLGNSFTILALFITALGLFGMAAFTAEQRTKEIGIRKVLGASVPGLVLLLTKDFSRLVLIAFLVFAPLAWWVTSRFLEQYQLRIELPLWVFPAAGLFTLVITMLIVSGQAIRAARVNPVESLRSE